MNVNDPNDPSFEADRRRRIRRNVIWLTVLALGFYIGFIVMSITRA